MQSNQTGQHFTNCVPTAPAPEVFQTYNPCAPQPPQYGSLYPPLPAAQVQQIKDYVKAQVKSESLRRAGNQGSSPWTSIEPDLVPGTAHPALPAEIAAMFPGLQTPMSGLQMPGLQTPMAGLQIPGLHTAIPGLTDPAVSSQPQSLLNFRTQAAAGGSPQVVNHEVTYFAPTYATNEHKECINCCEDCCEDVCENLCLNCCLDCSKVTNAPSLLFGSLMSALGLSPALGVNGNNAQYVLLPNTAPINPLTGLPAEPMTVCPIHAMTGCPTPAMAGCPANPLSHAIPLVTHPMTGCQINPLTGLPMTVNPVNPLSNGNIIGNISVK
jgi:hypothetical protein